jgi:hypothetical protein
MSPILMAYLPEVHCYAIFPFVKSTHLKRRPTEMLYTFTLHFEATTPDYFITLSIPNLLKPTGNFTYHNV